MKIQICPVCQCPWCKHSHHSWFHATKMSLNSKLERGAHVRLSRAGGSWLQRTCESRRGDGAEDGTPSEGFQAEDGTEDRVKFFHEL